MVVLCHSMSLRDLHISIHVPAWGTTWRFPADEGVDRYFNPRSRVGNDEVGKKKKRGQNIFQSTFPRGERHHDT